jgi:hypothetical protein
MASSIETTSTTTTLKNNGNTYMSVDTNDDVAITNTLTATSPTFVTPALGTPASGTLTNCSFPTLNQNTSGTAAGLSATLAVGSGGTGVTSSTGSGNNVLSASPALTGTLTTAAITASGTILQSKAGNTELMSLNTTGTVKGGIQCLSNQSVRLGSTTNYPTEIVVNNAAKLTVGTNGVVTLAAPLPAASGGTGNTSGGGKVLQCLSFTKTNVFTTTSGTYVGIGLSVAITPSSTSSKILVRYDINAGIGGHAGGIRLYRGTNPIGLANVISGATHLWHSNGYDNGDNNHTVNTGMGFLDSPSTTSSQTYNVKIACVQGGGTFRVNDQTSGVRNTSYSGVSISTITVMEIGA